MHLILVRHGDAHAGFHGVIGGPTGCTGLTDRGREQAAALRDFFAVSGRVRADVLLSSVIPRAIETAEIIAPGLGIETFGRECDLCEVHTGEADGLEWAEWGVRYGSFDMEADPDRVFPPVEAVPALALGREHPVGVGLHVKRTITNTPLGPLEAISLTGVHLAQVALAGEGLDAEAGGDDLRRLDRPGDDAGEQ